MYVTRKMAIALGLGGSSVLSHALAVPPDLSGLTGAIDLTTVVAAIVAVAVFKFAPQITKYAVAAISRMFPK